MHLNAFGFDRRGEFRKDAIELLREFRRIAAGSLLHGEDDRLLSVERCAAATRFARDRHIGDITEPERTAARERNRRKLQRRQGVCARNLAQRHLFPADVCKISGTEERPRVARRIHYVKERKSRLGDPPRIRRDAVFRKPAADDRNLPDAGNAEKTRPKVVFGEFTHLKGGNAALFPRKRDKHDLARYRHDRRYLRVRLIRQALFHAGETFEHVESGARDIHAPVEIHPDEGQSAA